LRETASGPEQEICIGKAPHFAIDVVARCTVVVVDHVGAHMPHHTFIDNWHSIAFLKIPE